MYPARVFGCGGTYTHSGGFRDVMHVTLPQRCCQKIPTILFDFPDQSKRPEYLTVRFDKNNLVAEVRSFVGGLLTDLELESPLSGKKYPTQYNSNQGNEHTKLHTVFRAQSLQSLLCI